MHAHLRNQKESNLRILTNSPKAHIPSYSRYTHLSRTVVINDNQPRLDTSTQRDGECENISLQQVYHIYPGYNTVMYYHLQYPNGELFWSNTDCGHGPPATMIRDTSTHYRYSSCLSLIASRLVCSSSSCFLQHPTIFQNFRGSTGNQQHLHFFRRTTSFSPSSFTLLIHLFETYHAIELP